MVEEGFRFEVAHCTWPCCTSAMRVTPPHTADEDRERVNARPQPLSLLSYLRATCSAGIHDSMSSERDATRAHVIGLCDAADSPFSVRSRARADGSGCCPAELGERRNHRPTAPFLSPTGLCLIDTSAQPFSHRLSSPQPFALVHPIMWPFSSTPSAPEVPRRKLTNKEAADPKINPLNPEGLKP